MMNEIPAKTRTGERTNLFRWLLGRNRGWIPVRQLAEFEAAGEDESAIRVGKARWKAFGSSRCVAIA